MRYILLTVILIGSIFYLFEDELKDKVCASDLMGVWEMGDDAFIELKNDGSCQFMKVDFSQFSNLDCYKNKRVSLSGKWDYKEYFKHIPFTQENKLCLVIKDNEYDVTFSLALSVKSGRNLLGEKTSLKLYAQTVEKKKYELRKLY